jgi:hypothetical protein
MKHPGHTYGGFVPAISERGVTTVAGTRVHELSIIESCQRANQRLRLKKCKDVLNNLIVAINAGMDDSW